ncbi:MAG: SusD/RagB family nutrient-binding outer membrane lipoprotein [Bacteroidota bacterium]|nr:SusD/RagB family nutrient-binding outer membrane lipoprotein [Bacteroidota bacterium]
MKKILYIVILACLASACVKDLSEINKNPNQLDLTNPDPVFLASELNTVNFLQSANSSCLWQYSHWITTATGGYGITSYWSQFYLNMLSNLKQLHLKYDNNSLFNNRMQVVTIWECYIYSIMVQAFGPVPRSQAMLAGTKPGDLQYGLSNIKFDSEDSIYYDILSKLRTAANSIKLSNTADAFGKVNEPIFGGDNAKWQRFANSLRLKLALDCRSFMPDTANAMIKELMANENNLFNSSDKAAFAFGTSSGSESNYWQSFLKPSATVFYNKNASMPSVSPKMNDFMLQYFRSYKDPRMNAFFDSASYVANIPNGGAPYTVTNDTIGSDGTMDPTGKHRWVLNYYAPHFGKPIFDRSLYWGSLPVLSAGSAYYDQPKISLLDKNHAFVIMTYAEICFIKAEAALLGLGGSKTAADYYNAGIDASMAFWGIDSKDAADFKNRDGIKWNTIGTGLPYPYFPATMSWNINDNFTQIWDQRWVNYYIDQAFDAWVLQRRTKSLDLAPLMSGIDVIWSPNSSFENIPERWIYPITGASSSVSTNLAAYNEAVKMLGGTNNQFALLRFSKNYAYRNWGNENSTLPTPSMYFKKLYGPYIESYPNTIPGYTLVKEFDLP